MSADRRRTWEHALETVVLLCAAAFAAVAVLPGAGVPGWLLPLVEMLAGTVTALSVWGHTGRGALAVYCAVLGGWLGMWTIWAELTRVWNFAVLGSCLAGVIILAPAAALCALAGRPAVLPPGSKGARAAEEDPDAEHREEMARFEHMFRSLTNDKDVRVMELARERAGRMVRLALPNSGTVTLDTLSDASKRIEVILHLQPGSVEFATGAHAAEVIMRLRERHEIVSAVTRLRRELYARTVNDKFAVGIEEDGDITQITMREVHIFIAGMPGAGKSNLLNVIMAQLARCPDALIWVIDMKGGRTARPWLQPWVEGKAERPAIDWVATTREEAALMVQAMKMALGARMNSGVGGSKIRPTASRPQIILITDEMANLFSTGRGQRKDIREEFGEDTKVWTNAQFVSAAEEIVQEARSEAGTLIFATQRGTNAMAGSTTIRALCKLKIALGMANKTELSYVIPDARIGQEKLSRVADEQGAGIIAVSKKASGVVKFFKHDHLEGQCSEGENEETGCVAACPVYQTALEVGTLRPVLDKMTAAPLGDIYARRWERAAGQPALAPMLRLVPGGASAATAVADVDTSEFDNIMRAGGIEDPDEKIGDVQRRMRQLLEGRGVMGATPKWLVESLEREGHEFARETVQRWLARDEARGLLHHADYGRWVWGPEKETGRSAGENAA